jgi:hypothetical protein
MQVVIEEIVRWIGFGILRVVTLGRYRGGRPGDELPEGAIGLALIIGTTFLVLAAMR